MRIMFQLRKIFKAYYGFRVLYVFPFPSAGHGPTGSGRDNHVAHNHTGNNQNKQASEQNKNRKRD